MVINGHNDLCKKRFGNYTRFKLSLPCWAVTSLVVSQWSSCDSVLGHNWGSEGRDGSLEGNKEHWLRALRNATCNSITYVINDSAVWGNCRGSKNRSVSEWGCDCRGSEVRGCDRGDWSGNGQSWGGDWGGGSGLWCYTGFVGGDGSSETESIGNVVDSSLTAVNDTQWVWADYLTESVSRLRSWRSASSVTFFVCKSVVSEAILTSGLSWGSSAEDGGRGGQWDDVGGGNAAESEEEDDLGQRRDRLISSADSLHNLLSFSNNKTEKVWKTCSTSTATRFIPSL